MTHMKHLVCFGDLVVSVAITLLESTSEFSL
jgi:hypothetical protein